MHPAFGNPYTLLPILYVGQTKAGPQPAAWSQPSAAVQKDLQERGFLERSAATMWPLWPLGFLSAWLSSFALLLSAPGAKIQQSPRHKTEKPKFSPITLPLTKDLE